MIVLEEFQTIGEQQMSVSFIKQVVEQAVKTFVTAFLGAWVAAGSDLMA